LVGVCAVCSCLHLGCLFRKRLLSQTPQDVLESMLRAYAVAKLDTNVTSPEAVWRAVLEGVSGHKPPSLRHSFPCAGAFPCSCDKSSVSFSLFDDAVMLVLKDLETSYFPRFVAVNPFYLAYVQLYHFCGSRRLSSVRCWKWIGRIGRGGYGAVYLAQRTDTGTVLQLTTTMYPISLMTRRAQDIFTLSSASTSVL
jgi:hypothetical protein